jgi:DNA (cytosine-5)-methyltransferase 1
MKHFDLFSGYGGFTLALEKAYVDTNARTKKRGGQSNPAENQDESLQEKSDRIEVGRTGQHSDGSSEQRQLDTVGFSEIDKYASAVLKYRWPNIKNYGNISKIDWATVPDFDLLTGGSPCQDLSIAGKRAGLSGKRSGLFFEYMRAVKEKKPKYFIWENVKGALSSRNGWDFAAVINEMAEAGYALWWQVLNAKDFGVPQNRERIFVIGFRDGSPREVFFERGGAEQNLNEITKNASQGYRVYETDGIATNLASQAGGVGAKTGLYAIPEATKQGYSIAGGAIA